MGFMERNMGWVLLVYGLSIACAVGGGIWLLLHVLNKAGLL